MYEENDANEKDRDLTDRLKEEIGNQVLVADQRYSTYRGVLGGYMKRSALVAAMFAMSGCVELGIVGSVYDGEIKTDIGYQAKIGKRVYAWGSYEPSPRLNILGQPIGRIRTWGYGVGARKDWKDVSAFVEFGICDPKIDTNPIVQHEVVNRVLMNHHGDRAPFQDTSYRLNQGNCGRLGVGYDVTKHIRATFAYRFFKPGEDIDAWNGPHGFVDGVPFGDFWQERGTLDLNAAEFGLSWIDPFSSFVGALKKAFKLMRK